MPVEYYECGNGAEVHLQKIIRFDPEEVCREAKAVLASGNQSPKHAWLLGMCYERGFGMKKDQRLAGWYYRIGADMTIPGGRLMDDVYADRCRMKIVAAHVFTGRKFDPISALTIEKYCTAMIEHSRYVLLARLCRWMSRIGK